MKTLLTTALLIACLSLQAQPSTGRILTDGVVITAEDGSFTLSSEQEFWDVPFLMKKVNKLFVHSTTREKYNDKLTNEYDLALKKGAKKVKVKVPGFEKEFYGVLAFYDIPKSMEPCVRLFQIRVPSSYAAQATNGRSSVVYEYFHPKCKNKTGLYALRPWVLWLSDVPF